MAGNQDDGSGAPGASKPDDATLGNSGGSQDASGPSFERFDSRRSAVPSTDDAFFQVQSLLAEQAARNKLEQDMLLQRLQSSLRQQAGDFQEAHSLSRRFDPSLPASDADRARPCTASQGEFQHRTDSGVMLDRLEKQAFYPMQPGEWGRSQTQTVLDRVEGMLDKLSMHQEPTTAQPHVRSSHVGRLWSRLRSLASSSEPVRKGCLADFIDGQTFSAMCVVCVSLNAVFIMITTDYEMANPNSDATTLMIAIECSFLTFYVIELILKLCVHRMFLFWCDDANWNVLDVVAVVFSMVEMFFSFLQQDTNAGINYSFLRALRMFKFVKILRVMRSIRFFADLRVMFDCVLGSILSCMWSLLMVAFFIYLFALLVVQGLVQTVAGQTGESPWTEDQEKEIFEHFGSVGQAMLTLTMTTTGGLDWGPKYYLLLDSGSTVSSASFLAFILFFALAVWNIVASLFVEKALKYAQPDMEAIASARSEQDALDFHILMDVFKALDEDESGKISLKELQSIMQHPKFLLYLRARGIEVTDADLFHNMLRSVVGDAEPEIDIPFIVAACLRMKGAASSLDLHALSFESKLMTRRLRAYIHDNTDRLDRIERALAGETMVRMQVEGQAPDEMKLVKSLMV